MRHRHRHRHRLVDGGSMSIMSTDKITECWQLLHPQGSHSVFWGMCSVTNLHATSTTLTATQNYVRALTCAHARVRAHMHVHAHATSSWCAPCCPGPRVCGRGICTVTFQSSIHRQHFSYQPLTCEDWCHQLACETTAPIPHPRMLGEASCA